MQWSDWLEGVTGELYWNSIFAFDGVDHQDPSAWGGDTPPDPWTMQTPTGDSMSAGSGDGNLLAPGTPSKIGGETHVPIETVRLKSMRDGVEDFELLTSAAQRLGREVVRTQIQPFIRSAWDFEDSYQMLHRIRVALGRSFSRK